MFNLFVSSSSSNGEDQAKEREKSAARREASHVQQHQNHSQDQLPQHPQGIAKRYSRSPLLVAIKRQHFFSVEETPSLTMATQEQLDAIMQKLWTEMLTEAK